jgi:DNA-binding IclR family transcriptional regulator
MGPEDQDQGQKKEAMKQLRAARKQTIAAAAARLQEQQQAIAAIKAQLQQGDKTVPELAAATGIPSASILFYIAALKKYGEVAEGQADGGYFRYGLAADNNRGQG